MANQRYMENQNENLMEKITSLAKRRGFIYQGSEVYGGLAGTFDYGPLGLAVKNNIKNAWWKRFVNNRRDVYGLDASILMNAKVWEASGHVAGFSDPMVKCKKCQHKFRVDQLIDNQKNFNDEKNLFLNYAEDLLNQVKEGFNSRDKILNNFCTVNDHLSDVEKEDFIKAIKPSLDKLKSEINKASNDMNVIETVLNGFHDSKKYIGFVTQYYLNKFILCPELNCKAHNEWSTPQPFNMMFQTKIGADEDSASTVYLRPETAQGIFVNFKNIVDSFHPKLPFGIAQIGKAFRNEITPRDFIFRVREFEQMEVEYFVREDDWQKYFTFLHDEVTQFVDDIGLDMAKVHEVEVGDGDRAHYSKRTIDFEFEYPFGQKELCGLAYRGSFDLNNHKLEYIDEEAEVGKSNKEGNKITPHVIEPSMGVDRMVLALLCSAYAEDVQNNETRSYLKFKPSMAPIICAVSPLLKNKPELVEKAQIVFGTLKAEFGRVDFDDNGNIGKRYRRQDEIGTPWCIVIDFDTLGENPSLLDTVTIRDRDTGSQDRIAISELVDYIKEKLN